MARFPLHAVIVSTLAVAGCSFGPRFEAALPQVRDVPVVANLAPREALVRGRSFLAARQYGLAIELFKSARHEPSLRTESLNGLAIAYDAIGRRDIAERYFEEALASQPADERTRRNVARFYAATGQKDKQRAILAGTPGLPVAAAAKRSMTEEPDKAMQMGSSVTAARTAMSLERQSPLASLLPPMLVQAGLSAPPPPASSARTVNEGAEGAVECWTDRSTDAGDAPAGMTMFRLNMGEVFITTTPSGTTCRENRTPADSRTSNSEYLGRVAAYLDRLNRQAAAEEIATLWRAAFWPHRES